MGSRIGLWLLLAVPIVLLPRGHAVAGETAVDAAGICARCHAGTAAQLWTTDGHAPGVRCVDCHADRRGATVGPGHRAVRRCAECHAEAAHPVRGRHPRPGPMRRCLTCHDPHGSSNASLVSPRIRLPGPRRAPIQFTGADFVAAARPGTGLCEVCHRDTTAYAADGRSAAHYTDRCTACHDHAVGFQPVATKDNCAICHADETARLATPSDHHDRFDCGGCHAEVSPTPGKDHRAVTACTDCHATPATHAPGGNAVACAQCHDPHGSSNVSLVRDQIRTPQGTLHPIRLDNRDGMADGSYASASTPGTGLCEVCHETTRFYRADGTGDPHFTLPCFPCHRHADGFAPQQ
ncbi:MAG: cytochrome c3 family protein [Candidatus Binatia bacterium]